MEVTGCRLISIIRSPSRTPVSSAVLPGFTRTTTTPRSLDFIPYRPATSSVSSRTSRSDRIPVGAAVSADSSSPGCVMDFGCSAMARSIVFGFFSRINLTDTFFPTGVCATAFRRCVGESIGFPSYSTITSARSTPAFFAGLSSITSLTSTPLVSVTPNCFANSGVNS